jgi:hypothetical protein
LYLIGEKHATEDTNGRLQIFPENDRLLYSKDIILKSRPKYFKCFLGMEQEINGEKWKKKRSYICIAEIQKDNHFYPTHHSLSRTPSRTHSVTLSGPFAITSNHCKTNTYFMMAAKSTWALKLWALSGKVPLRTSSA